MRIFIGDVEVSPVDLKNIRIEVAPDGETLYGVKISVTGGRLTLKPEGVVAGLTISYSGPDAPGIVIGEAVFGESGLPPYTL